MGVCVGAGGCLAVDDRKRTKGEMCVEVEGDGKEEMGPKRR